MHSHFVLELQRLLKSSCLVIILAYISYSISCRLLTLSSLLRTHYFVIFWVNVQLQNVDECENYACTAKKPKRLFGWKLQDRRCSFNTCHSGEQFARFQLQSNFHCLFFLKNSLWIRPLINNLRRRQSRAFVFKLLTFLPRHCGL